MHKQNAKEAHMANVVELNDLNFDKEVKESKLPVLVDFYATWCGPCRKQIPVISNIAEKYSGKVKVGKINVETGQLKSMEYGISSIPALMVFKNGKVVEAVSGLHSENELAMLLQKHAS